MSDRDARNQGLAEDYPAIAERAKIEGGAIHWGDETALVNINVHGCGYAPKGKTPVTHAPDPFLVIIEIIDNFWRGPADRIPPSAYQGSQGQVRRIETSLGRINRRKT